MKKYKKAAWKNKLKTIALTMNDEFELAKRSYSASDIQYYFKYIWKKHKIKIKNPPIYVYTNRISNRLVLNKKDGYKLELKMPETMKLFGSTKN